MEKMTSSNILDNVKTWGNVVKNFTASNSCRLTTVRDYEFFSRLAFVGSIVELVRKEPKESSNISSYFLLYSPGP